MTRARQTLTLARPPGPHRLQDALGDVPSVLHREETIAMSLAVPELFRRSNLTFSNCPGSNGDSMVLAPGDHHRLLRRPSHSQLMGLG